MRMSDIPPPKQHLEFFGDYKTTHTTKQTKKNKKKTKYKVVNSNHEIKFTGYHHSDPCTWKG